MVREHGVSGGVFAGHQVTGKKKSQEKLHLFDGLPVLK
jgi:hypothetical protein